MPYLDVAWSLQHEVFFYALAAIIVPRFGLKGLAVTLFVSASIAFYLGIHEHSLPISRYHADFLAGVLAFMLRGQLSSLPKITLIAAGLGMGWVAVATGTSWLFPFSFFAITAWITSIKVTENVFTNPFIKLGDASYSLYLFHPAIFLLARRHFTNAATWTQEPLRWGSIIACCLLSYAAWRFLEEQTIGLGESLLRIKSWRSSETLFRPSRNERILTSRRP